jgi:3-methyladenine DNA glycosylase AlkD
MALSLDGQVKKAIASLRNAGDPERAKGLAGYFHKDANLKFFGIKSPEVRALEKEQFSTATPGYELKAALEFTDRMVRRPELEAKIFGFARLHRFRKVYKPSVITACTGWLRDDYCGSWAAVDDLCNKVVSPLVKLLPDQLAKTQKWGAGKGLWLRRASVVVFVPFVRRGDLHAEAYAAVLRHLGNPEDLMHKAMGWVLREAGNMDRGRLEKFLLKHRVAVPRTTVRYAIEKFPEKQRKEFLKLTSIT